MRATPFLSVPRVKSLLTYIKPRSALPSVGMLSQIRNHSTSNIDVVMKQSTATSQNQITNCDEELKKYVNMSYFHGFGVTKVTNALALT